jgi:hypothetical protein
MKKTKKTTKKISKSSVRLVNQPLSEWRVFARKYEKPTEETFDENQRWIPGGVRFVIYKVCYDSKGKPNGIVEYPDTTVQVKYSDYEGKDEFQRPLHKAEQESRQNLRDMSRAWDRPILVVVECGGGYSIREWKGTTDFNRLERMCDCPKKTKRKTKR